MAFRGRGKGGMAEVGAEKRLLRGEKGVGRGGRGGRREEMGF